MSLPPTTSRERLGAICGAVFGAVAVVVILPLSIGDKWVACVAVFVNRLAIGIVIGMVRDRRPGWLTGLGLGVLLSLPDAIRTDAYITMLGLGAIGGAVIGFIVTRYGR